MSMSESTETMRSKRAGRTSSRNRRRNTARENRPLGLRFLSKRREVDREKLDAIAQRRRELVEAGRHVVRLADEDDLVAPVRLGLDERGDGAHRRGEERAVRREAIGGSHEVPFSPFDALARRRVNLAVGPDCRPARLESRRLSKAPSRWFARGPRRLTRGRGAARSAKKPQTSKSRRKRMKMKRLLFAFFYFSESRLFNGLRPIPILFFPPRPIPLLESPSERARHRPTSISIARFLILSRYFAKDRFFR